jgi:hypothetical protein
MKRTEIRKRRKMCRFCHSRQARYRYSGRVRWDRFHTLCFRCYHSLRDRLACTLLAA